MKQRLIVEGQDAIVLATICKLRGLPAPQGYAMKDKFINEFVQVAGGIGKVNSMLNQLLKDTSVNNIGVVVDANNVGAQKRWESLKSQLSRVFPKNILSQVELRAEGAIISEEGFPTVGIWVMPNNVEEGYLEHFLTSLVRENDSLLPHVEKTIEDLMNLDLCRFTETKKQKALLHTWLTWQKEPGKTFGGAANSRYFDINAPAIDPLLNWFKQTFTLESN